MSSFECAKKEVKWTIIKFIDDGIIEVKKLNDLRSKQGHDEEDLEEGDNCLAKYDDNEYYEAKILLITDDKEKALREKKVFLGVQKAERKNPTTKKNQTGKKQKDQKKKSKENENPEEVKKVEKPPEKRNKKRAETKTDENDETKKKKKELAALEKRKREATAVSAQERAAKLFAIASCSNVHVGRVDTNSQPSPMQHIHNAPSLAETFSSTNLMQTNLNASISPVLSLSSNPPPVLPLSSYPPPLLPLSSNPPPVLPLSSYLPPVLSLDSNPPPVLPLSSNPPPVLPLSSYPPPVLPLSSNPPPVLPLSSYPPPLLPLSSYPPPVLPLDSNPSPVLPLSSNPPPILTLSSNPPPVLPLSCNPPPLVPLSSYLPPVFPLSSNPSPILPINSNPPPLLPLSSNPSPVLPLDSNSSPILPLDSNSSPVLPLDSNPSPVLPLDSNPSPVLPPISNLSTSSPSYSDFSFSNPNLQPLLSSTPTSMASQSQSFFDPSISSAISYSLGIKERSSQCERCEVNEITIRDLRMEIASLKNQLEGLQANSTSSPEGDTEERERDYYAKTRPRMKMAKYYITDPVNPGIKEGYKQLAPGAPVVIDALWLHGALSSVRGKDKAGSKKRPQKSETIIKHLMDGFFTISDLVGKGGTYRFQDSPIYISLKSYGEVVLKMSAAAFNAAWNEKLSSARRTKKRLEYS